MHTYTLGTVLQIGLMELVMKSDGVHTKLGSCSTNICRILNVDFHLEFSSQRVVFFFICWVFMSLILKLLSKKQVHPQHLQFWLIHRKIKCSFGSKSLWLASCHCNYLLKCWNAASADILLDFLCQRKIHTPCFSSFFSHKILFHLFMELWDPLRFVGFVQSYYLVVFCFANGDLARLPALSTETLTVQFLCTWLMWCW